MFKDIVGKIDPNKMFNVWRFSKSRSTYNLVSDTIINIKDEKLIKAYKTMAKKGLNMSSWFLIREIGERAEDEVITQGLNRDYDAWVLANISVYDDTIDVWIDLFKKDTLCNKLLYFIRGTCVKSEK